MGPSAMGFSAMNIILFIASDEWGGAENSFVSIARELSKSHQITVLLVADNKIEGRFDDQVEVKVIQQSASRLNPFLYLELIRTINSRRPDIIHTHGAKAAQLIDRVRWFIAAKHIATKHNSRKGNIFNNLKYVTTVSEVAAKSITHENVRIIYNGVIPRSIQQENNALFTIRAIGRLEDVKQYDCLIRSVQGLDFSCKLEIIGEGAEHSKLQQQIDRTQSREKRIHLLGYRDDIPEKITGADLMVICSKTEGFSLVLIESLFYAKVLISTRVGGSTEVLTEAYLFDIDKLCHKITEVHRQYSDYKNGFEKIKEQHQNKFVLSHVVEKYVDYYKMVQNDG